jgi:hypothetical protein
LFLINLIISADKFATAVWHNRCNQAQTGFVRRKFGRDKSSGNPFKWTAALKKAWTHEFLTDPGSVTTLGGDE